jgi:NAD(P)-dependent dehydrogenase (short-subunit alcohol dehydrogenase family)
MPVALIIGVGAGIGQASATAFAAAGYKVAVASRTQKLDSTQFPFFEFDASESTKVPALFEKVRKDVGVPTVVVYNGMYLHHLA